jgi:hypothetical protein
LHGQKWDVRRKHEVEPRYVANSEPAIWQRGEVEQACKSKATYPENRTEVKLDGIWGGDTSYPGKPYCSDV